MKINRILLAVICLCVWLMPCAVYAASTADANEPIITTAECSLSLNYVHGETVFANLPIQVYCVATVSSDFQYTLTDAFLSTGLTVNGISSTSEWDAMRTTWESFIVSTKLAPERSAHTDLSGSVHFDGLTPGLYFVMPVQFTKDGSCYSFDSALIAVPSLDEHGLWVYDITANPKLRIDVPSGETKEYQVVKLWRDNGNEEKRPTGVTVDILCNGEVVESVILSENNHWSYTWSTEDNGAVWQVAEQNVPEGYIVTVEEHAASFTIINTIPGASSSPQTGDSSHMGLYILLMCVSGLALVIFGTTTKRKSE